ncbi:MAG: chemotaxis protein CheD [Candidatus Delongbacteria bacterium]|nr:chemotaxis protein CheD [Candidatus Delongbacteria bacterium]
MIHDPTQEKIFVKPGYIYIRFEPTLLYTVVGSGVVVTVYDRKLRYGGMNYYLRPIGKSPDQATAYYAFPGIVHLINLFTESGSVLSDLEAHIFGGAENNAADGYIHELAEKNVSIARRILELKKVPIIGQDIGSSRGRKIALNSASGEIMVAKVEHIRNEDWYPAVQFEFKPPAADQPE